MSLGNIRAQENNLPFKIVPGAINIFIHNQAMSSYHFYNWCANNRSNRLCMGYDILFQNSPVCNTYHFYSVHVFFITFTSDVPKFLRK